MRLEKAPARHTAQNPAPLSHIFFKGGKITFVDFTGRDDEHVDRPQMRRERSAVDKVDLQTALRQRGLERSATAQSDDWISPPRRGLRGPPDGVDHEPPRVGDVQRTGLEISVVSERHQPPPAERRRGDHRRGKFIRLSRDHGKG